MPLIDINIYKFIIIDTWVNISSLRYFFIHFLTYASVFYYCLFDFLNLFQLIMKWGILLSTRYFEQVHARSSHLACGYVVFRVHDICSMLSILFILYFANVVWGEPIYKTVAVVNDVIIYNKAKNFIDVIFNINTKCNEKH